MPNFIPLTLGQIRSLKCPAGGPSTWETSPRMLHRLSRVKLGKDMGTHLGRSMPMFELVTLTTGVRGS